MKKENSRKIFDSKEDGSPWKIGEYSDNLGKYFLGYRNKEKNLQNWGSKEKLEDLREKRNGYEKARVSKLTPVSQIAGRERKRGDVCPDTKKIFWHYLAGGVELWIKPENVEKYNEKQKEIYRRYIKKDSSKVVRNNSRKKRYKEDELFALRIKLSNRVLSFCKRRGVNKKSNTEDLIGANWGTVKIHLESQFTEGMSWENSGKWHIDHKIPASRAKTEEEMYELFHYTNLQPLWGPDNLSKGAKTQEEWEEFKKLKGLLKSFNQNLG